jgi:hypothetical protein
VAQVLKAPGALIAVLTVVLWLLVLYCLWQYLRLIMKAQREAGGVAGISEKARPPVRSVAAFETWANKSKYSRLRDATPGPEGPS